MVRTAARRPARERLLDAAEELFVEHGIAATGVDAVLRRAEVAPATLYAHFAGKDHLVAAYLQRRHERWRAAWDDALDGYFADHDEVLTTGDALGLAHLKIEPASGPPPGGDPDETARLWLVTQTIEDPDADRDWVIEARVDLDATDDVGELVLLTTAMRRL